MYKICFGVYSCNLTAFIFYVYFNSDFILGSFLLFGAVMNKLFLGSVSKNVLGSTHVVFYFELISGWF